MRIHHPNKRRSGKGNLGVITVEYMGIGTRSVQRRRTGRGQPPRGPAEVHHPNQKLRRWDPLVAMGKPNLLLPPREVEGRDLSCLPSLSTTIQIQLLDSLEEPMKHQWKSMALPLPV